MAPDEFRNKKKGTIPADGYLGAGARSSMSALSIRKRLTLLIGMLLFVIVGASTWAAYRGVRDSATEVGRERLRNLTQQFAALSQQSTAASLNRTSVVANYAAVRTFLQSPSSATREAGAFLHRRILIGLLILTIGIAGAFALSGTITRPLHSLTAAASAITSDDYPKRVEIHRDDEFDALAAAFNAMVDRLRVSNAELEQKIEALAESERQYRFLFESSPLPMWVFDSETLRFLAVNQAAVNHYGFAREEFLSMTVTEIRPPEEVPRLMEALADYAKGLSRSGIWKHRKRSGEVIDVEVTAHPINFDGRAAELVLANDVTDRLRAQEALRTKSDELAAATQQLWQASKLATMGELAASVAHELNNPLSTIALRVESLATAVAGDERKELSVEIISDEVERMAKLVGNLLQFSRRSHAQISTVNVGDEIRNSVEFIHFYLRNRKVNVIYDIADELPKIRADRQQLRQLFLNLLTNGCDAMPHGGKLTVRTAHGELPGKVDAVIAEFVDTGIGISAGDLENIWEPFFTTKPEGKGTGLGLAICRRVVEEHQGKISINSRLGQGTTVTINLPATIGCARTEVECRSKFRKAAGN